MKWTASTLAAAIAVLVAAPAMSVPGAHLAWDDCRAGGGSTSRAFACDTNTGSHTLVLSVAAPSGIDRWNSFEGEIGWYFTGPQPEWWKLRNQTGQQNQCRNGALSVSASGAGLSGCTDLYGGNAAGGIGTYQNGPNIPSGSGLGPGANRARMLLVFAIPVGSEVPLVADATYFVAKVVISNAKTVDPGACAGCQLAACIFLNAVRIGQPSGSPGGNPVIYGSWYDEGLVSWHSAWMNDCGCSAGGKNSMSTCAICPPKAATWGAVKSLYR